MLAVAVSLGEGRWLNLLSRSRPPDPFWEWSTLLSVSLSALILSLLMIWMVRRITFPLAHLSAAADRFGRGEASEPIAEQGPSDIQHTIRAFNQMRARLERFVHDRTHMLAAISHDLRTPITALRVRAELIEDLETRRRIVATLDEMQHMTEATLAFVREESDQEETRLIDLTALVESLCDDLSDTGQPVSFSGPDRLPYRCRSVSLKRALGNLVENAVTYGQRARVALTEQREGPRIDIDDDGPGIADPDRERVFEPFVRLEASRSLDTGGVGLGMAIARSIVRQHGGDITLANREEGGLRTTVGLPREDAPHGIRGDRQLVSI
jgi:signal transduction histidine kinase